MPRSSFLMAAGGPAYRILALVVLTRCLAAEGLEAWRFWGTADGFAESFSGGLALAPDGRIWVKHGRVDNVSVLDGFTTLRVPAPPTLDPGLWVVGPDSILARDETGRYFEYRRHQWEAHNRFADKAATLGGPSVFLLQPDQLLEYTSATRAARVIRRASPSGLGRFLDLLSSPRSGLIWVLAQHGLASFQSGTGRWTEYPCHSLGLQNPSEPFEDDDGALFLVASESSGGAKVLVRFLRGRWQTVYRGQRPLVRGWPGTAGTLWLQDTDGLHELVGGRRITVEQQGPLSGNFRRVVRQSGGVFWVATNQGTARYAAPLWRTPPAVAHIRSGIEAAWEDAHGVLWFASLNGLLRLQKERLTEYPFPPSGAIPRSANCCRAPTAPCCWAA